MPLFLAILLIVIIVYIWRSKKNKSIIRKIKKDPAFTVATITKYRGLRYRWKNNIWFYYECTIENQRFKGRTKNYHKVYYMENFKYLNGQSFPFIYCVNNHALGRMLITEKDFKDFELTQPDQYREFNKKLL